MDGGGASLPCQYCRCWHWRRREGRYHSRHLPVQSLGRRGGGRMVAVGVTHCP